MAKQRLRDLKIAKCFDQSKYTLLNWRVAKFRLSGCPVARPGSADPPPWGGAIAPPRGSLRPFAQSFASQ
ncbi:hypothetical protein GCM10016455_03720 [Aliiroseovarius zhejiangensis]|uniref:Transposase n=1 Tax=Aliiroseovarius zhejiangensis TaxID=1632025 RepID=A0ABQ3IPN5_9RHOB|nr:hypothetical protein GCM10016455_03720 [Aliiroseovarius zhejiangensis]